MVYSHQESPLVHLLWSTPNTMLICFCFFGAVRFHTALFASESEIVSKTTHVLRSSIHWFIHSTVLSLFGTGPIAVFTPAQTIRTKGVNELEFDSIKPIKTGVNTPLVSMSCQINTFILFKYLKPSKRVHEFIKASF